MALTLKDHDRHSYADYLRWPEDVRYELIDGVAYLHGTRADGPPSGHRRGDIFRQIANALEGKPCRVFIAPVDVRLPKADEADEAIDTVVQPDVLVVCDERKSVNAVCAAPPTSWSRCCRRRPRARSGEKAPRLRTARRPGVLARTSTDQVLTVYRLMGAEYGKPDVQELAGETPIGALPGLTILWDALAARLPRPEY